MSEPIAVLDEEVWNSWLQKAKLREMRSAYRMKIFAAVVLALAGLGGTSYFLGLFQATWRTIE